MTTLTQGIQTGEFLLSEADGMRAREQVTATVAGAVALQSGQVMGKITAGGKYVAHNTGAADGSQVAAGVLYTPLPGVNGDYKATVFVRDCEVIGNRLNGGTTPIPATITALAALGVIVR